jgi:hypothetical protein
MSCGELSGASCFANTKQRFFETSFATMQPVGGEKAADSEEHPENKKPVGIGACIKPMI